MQGYAAETITQTPGNPAYDNQKIFRAILQTMSRPGTITRLGNLPTPPAGLHPAAAAVCLTLLDLDTPLWMGACPAKDILTYLRFQCGCPVSVKQDEADFGLILDGTDLPELDRFHPGDIEYPDRSATLIIQVKSFSQGQRLNLSGPGINGKTILQGDGLAAEFRQAMIKNNRRFPLGYDVILTTETEIVSLPRTVQVGL